MATTLLQGKDFRTEHESQFVAIHVKSGVLMVRPSGPSLAEREATIISADVRPVLAACGKSLRALVLDLSDVQMMSSFGLGMCIDLRNAANRSKALTIVYGLSQQLQDLFKMMKVERLYTIAQTPADLERALKR